MHDFIIYHILVLSISYDHNQKLKVFKRIFLYFVK